MAKFCFLWAVRLGWVRHKAPSTLPCKMSSLMEDSQQIAKFWQQGFLIQEGWKICSF